MPEKKIQVKLTTNSPQWDFLRQTPGSRGVWGDYEFHADDGRRACDFWVVFDGLKQPETATCPPGNTLLITGEPPSIKRYEPGFVRQFDTVVTTQKRIAAPHVVSLQLLPWQVGVRFNVAERKIDAFTKGYDELSALPPLDKPKLISVISSSKTTTRGHRLRLTFVRRLKEHFGDRLDVFGSGVNHVADKWDAIAPYAYHVAIENSVREDYWTEKLADAYLGESYPFYCGCPNIADYFSPDSFSPIDVRDPEGAISIIEKAIADDMHKKARASILESRRKVLDEYQLFPALAKVIDGMRGREKAAPAVAMTLRPEVLIKKNVIQRGIAKFARTYW